MVSEGSISLTVSGSLDAKRRRRGGKGRGDHDCTGKGGVGRVQNFFWRVIRRVLGDMTSREVGGGRWSHVGMINV